MRASTGKILESVPKSYRTYARLLLKYLYDKAVPGRISWDEYGVVTINGNVVKDSNISELINDAMRERKTVKATGRVQFARLLRVLNTSPTLVRNKELLFATSSSSDIEKSRPSASSTPRTRAAAAAATMTTKRRGATRKRKKRAQEEEKEEDYSLFLAPYRRVGAPITFMKNADSLPARKRRLLDWSKLKL